MPESTVSDVDRLWQETWPKIVARAWADEDFKNMLMSDTASVLSQYGLPVMQGMQYSIEAGNAQGQVRLPFPEKPSDFEDGQSVNAMGDEGATHFSDTSCCY